MSNTRSFLVLGAGLSGLACAREIQRAGGQVQVIEKNAHLGGRVRTRLVDGFRVDEGFQVLLDSYPELPHFLNLSDLKLNRFKSGTLIYVGDGFERLANPIGHPETLLATLFQNTITLADKTRVAALLTSVQWQKSDHITTGESSLVFLRRYGFSENFIEKFWRPFFTGVFLDSELSVDSGFFKFLLRSFATGFATLPSGGMQKVAELVAAPLSAETIHLNSPVVSWTSQRVELANGQTLAADCVICAFDPSHKSSYRKVTTFYFTSPDLADLEIDGWLTLIPRQYGLAIDHLALLTSVAPSYSESGAPLLSASVVGEKNVSATQVHEELEKIFKRRLALKHIATVPVLRALPEDFGSDLGFGELEGVYFCGDRWTTPSINGALRSGRALAEHLLRT